ncbi:TLC domain-containing protein [Geranomyces variabilis]|nr:TLC domain-containing protein [Geranomyces variabilis]KAJ3141523.1 hypothetical protein HDU90_005864 [Geranomyces variabilis]
MSAITSPIDAVAQLLELKKLPDHSATFLLSAAACQAIFILAHRLSQYSQHYTCLSPIKKIDWRIHVVSSFHAALIVILAYPLLSNETLLKDKIGGYDAYAGEVYAVACGYFLWDSVVCLMNIKQFGIGFALHGVSCLGVFLLSFRPFLMYYGAAFLMFELSTPFLNIHWFCDKTGRTGSTLQKVNGAILIVTFFVARIVFGFLNSYDFILTCLARIDEIPTHYVYFYGAANILLNALNVFWFSQMIKSIARRFSPAATERNSRRSGKSDSAKRD